MYVHMYVEPMPYHTSTYTGHKSNAAKFIELNSSKHERKKTSIKERFKPYAGSYEHEHEYVYAACNMWHRATTILD